MVKWLTTCHTVQGLLFKKMHTQKWNSVQGGQESRPLCR